MQYIASTPAEYLAVLEEDWRKDLLVRIYSMVLANGPDLTEAIEYKMLAFKANGKSLFHLNAQKNYVSLYVGDVDKVPESAELLQPFSVGKGCIRIRQSATEALPQLERFIQRTLELHAAGRDTDC